MNSNFNQQQQQVHNAAGGEERRFGNAGTPPGGFQNTGNYGTPPHQQHQMMGGNPRTPTGGVGMQNMGYGQMTQPMSYHPQSQGNSPAPLGQGGGGGSEFVNATNPGQSHQSLVQQPPHPQKELNVASFCRLGQETIQELVNKTNEMFGCLKATQPQDGKPFPSSVDRKQKLHEMLRAVKALLKRLRIIYDKMEEVFPSSDTLGEDVQSLIPYIGGEETSDVTVSAERKNTEAYRLAMEEYREVVEQVTLKNRDLKMTIDHLRQIIWEVNTMFAMRKD